MRARGDPGAQTWGVLLSMKMQCYARLKKCPESTTIQQTTTVLSEHSEVGGCGGGGGLIVVE